MPIFGCRANRGRAIAAVFSNRRAARDSCPQQTNAPVIKSSPPSAPLSQLQIPPVNVSESTFSPVQAPPSPPLYDPSPDIAERNPLSAEQVAEKLGVEENSLHEDVEITKGEDGSVRVVYRGGEDKFRVGYTTHDKAKSGDNNPFSDSSSVSATGIPGRYKLQVKKLENGEYEYTLDMHKNLSGAVLEVGSKKFVISSSGELSSPMTTLREEVRSWTGHLNDFSPSDRLPRGVTFSDVAPLNEYIHLYDRKRDPKGTGISSAEEAKLQSLGHRYRELIERFDLPYDPKNPRNYQ